MSVLIGTASSNPENLQVYLQNSKRAGLTLFIMLTRHGAQFLYCPSAHEVPLFFLLSYKKKWYYLSTASQHQTRHLG